ncbi:uncharacterized protein BT62DRAFT_996949 [Guyanagaster necrorhizus]|uniref:Uncharacterized protein n=1 Tax=Guyanagaster necrorhizus TaxID=856835 RepID=A0A9P8APG7_9AGAR|nr:uncharacterized protein BT62DRAFT_996949 [Guyanagaster necrorhizus MCA 3950]KAG7441847.1 hypothetical protein BT62DRAFT_996949 [Guyanagaster necrorhizus MCA 3950]
MAPRSFQHLTVIFCYLLVASSEGALASPLRLQDDPNRTTHDARIALISSYIDNALLSISPGSSESLTDALNSTRRAISDGVITSPALSDAETQYSQTMISNSQDDTRTPSPTPTSDAQTAEPTSTSSPSQDRTEDSASASPSASSYLWDVPSYTDSPSLTATLQDAASSVDFVSNSIPTPTRTSPIQVGPGLVIVPTSVSSIEQQLDLGTTTSLSATSDFSSSVPVNPLHTKTPQTSPKHYHVPVHRLVVLVIGFFSLIALVVLVYFVASRPSLKKWLNRVRGIKKGKVVRWDDVVEQDSLTEATEKGNHESSFSFCVTPPTPEAPRKAKPVPTVKLPWLTLPLQTVRSNGTNRSSLEVAALNGGLSRSRWSVCSSRSTWGTFSARSSESSGSWYSDDESVPERKSVPLLSPEVFFTLPSGHSESGNSRRSSAPVDCRTSKVVGKDVNEGGRGRSKSVGFLTGLSW